MVSHVWYVAYGSNVLYSRFACYLRGGTPEGTTHVYPGCRDRTPPAADVPLTVPGRLYFATHSPVWGGGRAFLDPDADSTVAARAYLITAGQFADVAAQEMYREPGEEFDLSTVLSVGRHEFGTGRYETLVCLGHRDGHPLLTFTSPWRPADVEHVPPSAAYLGVIARGLVESHGFTDARLADYFAGTAVRSPS
ncbi:hypothetical protein GCM10022243_22410 [Saccharothrix violaceirubra]